MNQWSFVVAAYVLVIGATLTLLICSAASMRRAEDRADALRERR